MRFFDAHCDTVMRAFDTPGYDFLQGTGAGHIDLPRALAAGSCVQIFAVFTSADRMPERDLTAYADKAIKIIQGWAEGSGGRFRLALTAEDVRAACDGGGYAGLLGLEGADCLGGQADMLEHYAAAGVRNVIPAWSDNAFSGTVFGERGPLTAEGERLIQACEAQHVMVDVSHLSDDAFWRVCEIARRPFIASHSNCRSVCGSPRNLSDEMIRELAAHGGVMGLNLAAYFIDPAYLAGGDPIVTGRRAASAESNPQAKAPMERAAYSRLAGIPRPPISLAAQHVLHAIRVGGEDCVGLGGDLDGVGFLPAEVTGIESYPQLAQALADAGLNAEQVDKVCWRNFARVFGEVLP